MHVLTSRCMASKRTKVTREKERNKLPVRTVFVIMPFKETPTRTFADLKEFFATNIKEAIEAADALQHRYVVRRSDDTFNITERIILDLYAADVVICDLSGHTANPNVMYELGVRLSVTNKAVILIREAAANNQRIFDIQGFYAFEYSPTRYRELEEHLVGKLAKLESGEEVFESPVLKTLRHEPSIVRQVQRERASRMLGLAATALEQGVPAMEIVIDRFLEQQYGIVVGARSTRALLNDSPEMFAEVDWSKLSFQPNTPPALQAVASEPLVSGLLDAGDEQLFNNAIARYFAKYFSVASLWDSPFATLLNGFLTETSVVALLLRGVAQQLQSPAEQYELDAVFRNLLQRLIAVPIRLYEEDEPASP